MCTGVLRPLPFCPREGCLPRTEMTGIGGAKPKNEERQDMDNENRSGTNKSSRDFYVIDIMHVLKALWQRAWIIVLAGIIAAGVGFSVAAFVITPQYSSSVMLYVNNSSFSL